MRYKAALLALLLMWPSPAWAQTQELAAQIQVLYQRHAADFERLSTQAFEGDLADANQQMRHFAEVDPSPAMCLLIGNMLYGMDPEASYRLHKKAYEAEPHHMATLLEWAMERHRKGEYEQAVPLYEEFLKLQPGQEAANALLADCLIRQNRLLDAVKAWNRAHHPSNHTGIDFMICGIYGPLSPLKRRGDLLARLQQGDVQVAEQLIDLDLHMDQDWWNQKVNEKGLQHDLALLEKTLGKDSPRMQALRCMVTLSTHKGLSGAQVQTLLTEAHLLLGDGALPESSLVASRLAAAVLDTKVETADQLYDRFGQALMERAKSQAGDVEALNMLCALSRDAKDREKLAGLERYGWERYGDVRFALGTLLIDCMADGKIRKDSKELQRALRQFPENSMLMAWLIQGTEEKDLTLDLLAQAIKAEYRKLSIGMAIPDSYRLKAYFYQLQQKFPAAEFTRESEQSLETRKSEPVTRPAPATTPSLPPPTGDYKKTMRAFFEALLRDDVATMKKCVYFSDANDESLIDAVLGYQVAQHKLGTAAVARFGQEGKELIHDVKVYGTQSDPLQLMHDMTAYDEGIKKACTSLDAGFMEFSVGIAFLRDTPKFQKPHYWLRLRNSENLWKIELFPRYFDSPEDQEERHQLSQELLHDTVVMNQLTSRISQGAFQDVEEAKAGWELARHTPMSPTTRPEPQGAKGELLRWEAKATQQGLTDVQRFAYQQMAQLRLCRPYPATVLPGMPDATESLIRMGLDVVPLLVEALDDTTPVEIAISPSKVNAVAASVITAICQREFAVGDYPDFVRINIVENRPELAPVFRHRIMEWYGKNRRKTWAQRRIDEVRGDLMHNRIKAIETIGRENNAAGKQAIVARMEAILGEQRKDSGIDYELATCAVALGQIGDKSMAPCVQRACDRLLHHLQDQQQSLTFVAQRNNLASAYQGLLLLGEEAAAQQGLEQLAKGQEKWKRAASPKLDLSEPKKTVQAYLQSLLDNDAVALRACHYAANEYDALNVEALLAMQLASHRFENVVIARLGPAGKAWVSSKHITDDETLRAAQAKIAEEKMFVEHDHAESNSFPATLWLVEGEWKIDCRRDLRNFDDESRLNCYAYAKAMGEIADQIESGKIHNVEEAKAEMQQRCATAMVLMYNKCLGPSVQAMTAPSEK